MGRYPAKLEVVLRYVLGSWLQLVRLKPSWRNSCTLGALHSMQLHKKIQRNEAAQPVLPSDKHANSLGRSAIFFILSRRVTRN